MNYQPTNSQDAARYGIQSLQKVQIRLDGVDRSGGEFFSALEGDSIYIEKTDFPFLFAFAQGAALEPQCFVAHTGVETTGAFKGLTIIHPLLTSPQTVPLYATLVIGKGCARFDNQYAAPFEGLFPSILVSTDTALSLIASVYVPPGTKWLGDFVLCFPAASVTSAKWSVTSWLASGFTGAQAPFVTGPIRTYNTANIEGGYFDVSQPCAGFFKLRDQNLPMPANALELTVNVVGTGMGFVAGNGNVKANFG